MPKLERKINLNQFYIFKRTQMSFLEKDQILENIKLKIRETEDDIKSIQRELLQKRTKISKEKQSSVRKQPKITDPDFSEDLLRGLPEDHYQMLGKLKQKVAVTRKKLDKVQSTNESFQGDIQHQNEEITRISNETVDVKSKLFKLSQKNRNQRENHMLFKSRKAEKQIAIKDFGRVTKDAETALTGLSIRASIPNEDRKDFKDYYDKLTFLENSIRRSNQQIQKMTDEINILNQALALPIQPENDEDRRLLESLTIPSDEISINELAQEVSSKEKELKGLRQNVMKKHTQSLAFEQKFYKIKAIKDERIRPSKEIPQKSVDELLKELEIAKTRTKGQTQTLNSQLEDKIVNNKKNEQLIQKKVEKLERLKIMNEREIAKLKATIKEQRDQSFDEEMSLIARIKELQNKIDNRNAKKKKTT